jgi:hypothetical protein
MSNAADIAKLVGVMAAAYPNTQVTDATIDVYVSMLQDIPFEILTASVQQCMSESDFMPSIAKLRERALKMTRPERVSALEAWGTVKAEMRRRGFYHSPEFSDPVIAKAVECIGWRVLCSSENEVADRAHFAKVYDSLVIREEEDARMLPAVRNLKLQTQRMIEAKSL